MPLKLAHDMTLVFNQTNPKRPGTKANERYNSYKSATTVAEALRCGATRADITSDISAGHCTLQGDLPPAGKTNVVAKPVGAEIRAASDVPAVQPAKQGVSSSKRGAESAASEGEPPLKKQAVGERVRHDEVDLSFATLDNKPIKFIKRVMGEARRLLSPQGLEEAKTGGYEFSLVDRKNLSKWSVKLSDLNAEGQLAKDLVKHKLDASIDIEVCLPDGFPLDPPFVRVVYPQLSGGFVFSHGGICFELLTPKGWVPAMTLPALAIAIKGILDYGEVRVSGVGHRESRTIKAYSEEGARKDHMHIVSAHREGESSTYGALKRYSS
mmetsp:Transcript_65789/g.174416  ORF Transcript_65789/g.174416 Transcript_65789/m.174416 type:complete len:325 (-) Transcript_65789:144-1118(-)|eukprot:CAMPEP_0194492306 /NCGR_PEP_ID=MMETSP0253-20130528/10906_1 /TAXON_ID=2966 /ORGANISM="Noctiluca scintillans" /LENGTH=324 /DNA_ID=CAMNT_0039333151 /DNA_START=58 /DNA_END=1032 /DNA_ORIENTATION=-